MEKTYIAIDLKSFYASVECVQRGLNPMTTNLLVADESRTSKTICLAVSPSLKSFGIPGRPRLFEAEQKVRQANALRKMQAPNHKFIGASCNAEELLCYPALAIDYIIAPPQMALYMQVSTEIYQVYLKYIAPEDIHVYSIDEVFIDATAYLKTYGLTAREFAKRIILDVLKTTGITATAGIGTNLFLCKVAMDIMAKKVRADADGVRIAELDEMSYRENLWSHRPLTDFWRVGRGYAKKLESKGLFTMGDIARCSLGKGSDFYNEELLYKMFGVNAQLLIDHAWGWEPCTIADIKVYKPESSSVGSGQVLHCAYDFDMAKLVLREMTDLLVLDLLEKGLVTNQMVLTVGYDIENLTDPERAAKYTGAVTVDHYGRRVPKHAHGSVNLEGYTSSTMLITDAMMDLYDRIVDQTLLVRRLNVVANHVIAEADAPKDDGPRQLDFFTDYEELDAQQAQKKAELERERRVQEAVLGIKNKFGKNAILRGMNLQQGATAKDRNAQIGGHKA